MKNIVNIIHFVRGVEPRDPQIDLFAALEEELKLSRKFGFPATILLQYDALIQEPYQKLLREYEDLTEIGLWLEVVQPLTEDSGIPWRGRYPWDWHTDVGFLIGYEPEERKRLIDTAFKRFREIFGYYPKSAGSWLIDAVSLDYMQKTYGITASCNCKDQFGTDGYTMWGGYYNGAYYPSKQNMFCPAQTKENQIDVPVFRMLGSDPVRQYDLGMEKDGQYSPTGCQGVASLEPVYGNSGADESWVEWYMKENFNEKSLSLAYTQAGQENSFGWPAIRDGLTMQFQVFDRLLKEGKIEILTLGESGDWFRAHYKETPAAAICVDEGWKDKDQGTVWYDSKYYRINLFYEKGALWIRDFYLFREDFQEKYLNERETKESCAFYNLPVMDGFRFSSGKIRAGIYPQAKNPSGRFFSETGKEGVVKAGLRDGVCVELSEKSVTVSGPADVFPLEIRFGDTKDLLIKEVGDKTMLLGFCGNKTGEYQYCLTLSSGRFETWESGIKVWPENGKIVFDTTAADRVYP